MSTKIGLLTDTASELTDEMLKSRNIYLVPLNVVFPDEGDKEYRQRVDITEEEYHKKLETTKKHPHTSQVSLVDFLNKFTEMEEDGYDEILYVSIGSGISATVNSANLAKKRYERRAGKARITIYDSKQASIGIGLITLKAYSLIQQNKTVNQIVDELEHFRQNELKVTFTVETLQYLMKGGRLSKIQYAMGSIFNIHPCLEVSEEGKLVSFQKERSYEDSIKTIIDQAYSFFEDKSNLACFIGEGRAEEGVKIAMDIINTNYPDIKIKQTLPIGAVIYTHAGPGTVQIDLFKDFEY